MADSTYAGPILIRGDMLGNIAGWPQQQGNPGDANFAMRLDGVQAMGSASDLYRLVWYQNTNSSATEFLNGQMWRLEVYNPAQDDDGQAGTGNAGWVTVPPWDNLTPKHDIAAGLGGGDEHIVLQGSGGNLIYDIRGNLPTVPTTLYYTASDEAGDVAVGDNDGQLDFSDSVAAVTCFATGTRIRLADGWRKVEDLQIGDLVQTCDDGPQPILWQSARWISPGELDAHQNLRPVCIRAGALGPGRPSSDLFVSPQHRMLLTLANGSEALVAAIRLTALPGISQVRARGGTGYHHFLLADHAIVIANGAYSESMLPGRNALRTLSAQDRRTLMRLLPALTSTSPVPARPILTGRQARHHLGPRVAAFLQNAQGAAQPDRPHVS